MANKKLTKADLKRMEQLSAKTASDKKAIATEKQKVNKMKKEMEAEKKKLAGQWKELKNAKKQAQNDKNFKSGVAQKRESNAGKNRGGGNKKLQEQLLEMKTKFNHEGKRARQFKQQVDQLTAENKVLQRKLKNLQGRKEKGEDPRIRNLLRENKQLKKQIKLLMIELNKKRRWFQRCIKSFKSSRSRWIAKQEDTLKKKGFLIKYVFLDDVKQIKQYKDNSGNKKGGKSGKLKFRNRIKIKSRDGGVCVLKDVEIVVLDNDDDDDDNDGGKGKKGKKKKGKKSKGDQLDEMEDYMAELEKEFALAQDEIGGGGDDYKDMDSDDNDFDFDGDDAGDLDGDYTIDQLTVDAAADGLGDDDGYNSNDKTPSSVGGKTPNTPNKGGKKTPKSPSKSPTPGKTPKSRKSGKKSGGADYLGLPVQNSIDAGDTAALQAQIVYLKKELDDRTDDIEKLKEIVSDGDKYPDPKGEVKNYILQINKRGDELVDKLDKELHAEKDDVDQMKGNNDRWQLWLSNLSLAMAKNGALFNQLLGVYEYYLKELKGRIDDLSTVNNTFYNDKSNEKKEDDNDDDGGYGDDGDDDEQKTRKVENGGDDDGDDNGDYTEKKEDDDDGDGNEDEGELSKLKKIVNDRHIDVEGQFKNIQEKQEAEDEEDEKDADDNYGADDKEKEALDANSEKVKEIRDNLVSNNINWKELIEIVSQDYNNASSEKNKLVLGLNDTKDELKALLDLVCKIPKRKILENDNDDDQEEQPNNDEEAAVGGDDNDDDDGDD